MTAQKLTVWKTPTARAKLKEIYTYSYNKWGKNTARDYMADLEKSIKSVAAGTKHPKINPNFSTRYPYCSCKHHYIFFEYQDDKLIVVTIFHKLQSVENRLAEEMPAMQQEINKVDD